MSPPRPGRRAALRENATFLLVPVGKAGFAALGLAITVLLSRHLGVEGYGHYATAVAAITLFAGLVQHAVDASLLRLLPERGAEDAGRAALFDAALALRLAGIGISVVVLAGAVAALGALGAEPVPAAMLPFMLVGVAATVLLADVQMYFQSRLRFLDYLRLDLVLNALRVASLGALLALGWLDLGAALAVYAGTLVLAVASGLPGTEGRRAALAGWRARMRQAADAARAMWRSGRAIGFAYAMSLLQSKLDLLVLGALGDPGATGLYAAALALAMLVEFAASFVLVVTYPRILPLAEAGKLRQMLMRYLAVALPAAAAITAVGIVYALPLVRLAFGEAFVEGAAVFAILIAGSAFMLAVQPIAAPFLTMRAPRLLVRIEILALVASAAGYIVAVPAFGAMGAAAVTTASRIGVGTVILAWAWRNA